MSKRPSFEYPEGFLDWKDQLSHEDRVKADNVIAANEIVRDFITRLFCEVPRQHFMNLLRVDTRGKPVETVALVVRKCMQDIFTPHVGFLLKHFQENEQSDFVWEIFLKMDKKDREVLQNYIEMPS